MSNVNYSYFSISYLLQMAFFQKYQLPSTFECNLCTGKCYWLSQFYGTYRFIFHQSRLASANLTGTGFFSVSFLVLRIKCSTNIEQRNLLSFRWMLQKNLWWKSMDSRNCIFYLWFVSLEFSNSKQIHLM